VTTERWAQVSRLYHAALAREERDRAALLAEACVGDELLRREVELLLAQSASAPGFLDPPALVHAAQMASQTARWSRPRLDDSTFLQAVGRANVVAIQGTSVLQPQRAFGVVGAIARRPGLITME
jgi:hypothetical protein